MKRLMLGIAGLLSLSACGADIIVGNASGGSAGAGALDVAGNAGVSESPGGTSNGGSAPGGGGVPGGGGAPGGASGETFPADCSVSPESYQTYSSPEELNALLIGRWRRCQEPRIAGEDIGVEFAEDGKVYPLTTNDSQEIVRRTGIDYEKSWAYTPPGGEDPISHQPSKTGFMVYDGVFTSAPDITVNPRQMRVLFTPSYSKYVPLLP
jgi:hypothetical protein